MHPGKWEETSNARKVKATVEAGLPCVVAGDPAPRAAASPFSFTAMPMLA